MFLINRCPLGKKRALNINTNNMRQDFDLYILDIVKTVGNRGTCNRGKSGCVIVKDKQILSVGYVGSPIGENHCDDVGHLMIDNHCVRTTHAEANAIVNAAKIGVAINGATLYCTMFPCFNCAKMIANSGIKRVVADYDYHDSNLSKALFDNIKLNYIIINDEIMQYGKQS